MHYESNDGPTGKQIVWTLVALVSAVLAVVVVWMAVMPLYGVYHQHQEGKAMLAKAEYEKQVLVQDAMARRDAAKSLAEAEVTRAEGVAKANKIIGESLNNNESYLHYLWIHNLEAGRHDVVYVPTETGLPIFEAGGRFHRQPRREEDVSSDGTVPR